MQHDKLADCLAVIKNGENVGKRSCETPKSKLVNSVLEVMKNEKYIGEINDVDDDKHKKNIELLGRINDCNVIKPRFPVKSDNFEKWEMRYLPARGFGILIVSTPHGVMAHTEAKKKEIGGKLLAYVY
ncbi:MAG: 30S ribosomal protein S8 [Candidatus Aenigmatarchaeota archaeon]